MSDRWVTQTTFYDPDSEGHGNCTEAAVASLLGIPLSDVPDFRENGAESWEFWDAFEAFFESRGFRITLNPSSAPCDGYYLASGPSARGCPHMVVMRDGELAHDPHPSRSGLISVSYIWVPRLLDPSLARSAS